MCTSIRSSTRIWATSGTTSLKNIDFPSFSSHPSTINRSLPRVKSHELHAELLCVIILHSSCACIHHHHDFLVTHTWLTHLIRPNDFESQNNTYIITCEYLDYRHAPTYILRNLTRYVMLVFYLSFTVVLEALILMINGKSGPRY